MNALHSILHDDQVIMAIRTKMPTMIHYFAIVKNNYLYPYYDTFWWRWKKLPEQWWIYIVKFWTPPFSRSKFFQFHAVSRRFGKILCWRLPPAELAPPPLGNPRSATAETLIDISTLICKNVFLPEWSIFQFGLKWTGQRRACKSQCPRNIPGTQLAYLQDIRSN